MIKTYSDLYVYKKQAEELIASYGRKVGNTLEFLDHQFAFTMRLPLSKFILRTREQILPSILALEADEYERMRISIGASANRDFTRDINGRRAVSLCTGCITYQHVLIREQRLKYFVHIRSMDIRKFIADCYYMITTAAELMAEHGLTVADINVRIDCLHKYTDKTGINNAKN